MGGMLLSLAPLVLLDLQAAVHGCTTCHKGRLYYDSNYNSRSDFSRVLHEHGRSDITVTCGPHTCGIGAQCINGVRPVCACLAGLSGDPLSQCIRIECVDNSECRSHQTCKNQHCVNPCLGFCGINAHCDVRNHIPVCTCPAGYTGNPNESCKIVNPGCNTCKSGVQRYINYPRSYFGRVLHPSGHGEHGRSDIAVTCGSQTCGFGAQCTNGSVRPVCTCPVGYSGDPYTQCIRIECNDNSKCRSHQICVNQHCINSCEGTCGINANCDVRNHIPFCTCPAGYTGNPLQSCRIFDPEELCHPSPCGPNTKCEVSNSIVKCTCLPGYTGSPIIGCRHECESDDECGTHQHCREFKCANPCSDCGVNAYCETVAAHRAVCKCPRGYHGDPYKICSAECTSNSECPSYKPVCEYNACIDPCVNAPCGVNADCNLRGLNPVCSCPKNMTGDPYTFCRPFEPRDLCEPNPCGANAKCTPGHDSTGADCPVCKCHDGYIGNPRVYCERGECELDSQCNDNLACVGYRCVDPCLGNTQCGPGAVCMARRHLAVCIHIRTYSSEDICHPSPCGPNTKCEVSNGRGKCTCLPGYTGHPLTGCRRLECDSDGECGTHQYCREFKCANPCSDCGVNAYCETVVAHRAVCKCPMGYHGDPYKICSAECTSNSECPSYKPVCEYNACIDPCVNAPCGVNADCNLRGLKPFCSCPKNMTGDPYTLCRPFEHRDLCEPNPCGANAKCTPGHDSTGADCPVCKCHDGYIGNPLVYCERCECEIDSQCNDNLACIGYRCVDPCLGNTQCGPGAVCMARRHLAVCTYPSGRRGHALGNCDYAYIRYKRKGNSTAKEEIPAKEAELAMEAELAKEEKPTAATAEEEIPAKEAELAMEAELAKEEKPTAATAEKEIPAKEAELAMEAELAKEEKPTAAGEKKELTIFTEHSRVSFE